MPLTATAEESEDSLRDFDLKIVQPKIGYRFSLDPLLLCDFVPADKPAILDLGTGCGIIPLVMARRSDVALITAVELQADMADLAARNASRNGLADRVQVLAADILDLADRLCANSFDLVMANPPYRKAGTGKTSPRAGRDLARHESSATLGDFLAAAKRAVKPGGSICFIYHPERLAEFLEAALALKLSPARLQLVHGDLSLPARMFLIELVKGRKVALEVLPPLLVKTSRYGADQQAGMSRAT
jgi:tRNA1Val (adenine37-N6)-methyltransferase